MKRAIAMTLVLFLLSLAASLAIHFYVTMMAFSSAW